MSKRNLSTLPDFFASSVWRRPWITCLSLPPTRIVVTIRDIPPKRVHHTASRRKFDCAREGEKEEHKRRVQIETRLKDWCSIKRPVQDSRLDGTCIMGRVCFAVSGHPFLHISVDLIKRLYILCSMLFLFSCLLRDRFLFFAFQIINISFYSSFSSNNTVILEWEREREERINKRNENGDGVIARADFTAACIQF